jgi:hypothetical protein
MPFITNNYISGNNSHITGIKEPYSVRIRTEMSKIEHLKINIS